MNEQSHARFRSILSVLTTLLAFLLAACALQGCALRARGAASLAPPPTDVAQIGELKPGLWRGYLTQSELPDSLALLPPPPAAGSAAQQADAAAYQDTRALARGPRGLLATEDANLKFPASANAFACALGFEVDPARSPQLAALLRRSFTDAARVTLRAKRHYQRVRPFVANHAHSCTPDDDAALAKDGSYPSGHSSLGWTWALILSELVPDQANAIQQRGVAYAESRVICGAHWRSDTVAGRLLGSATVAREHADPVFEAQLRAAKPEVAMLRARPQPMQRDCAAEAAALRLSGSSAP
ncbi:MAG: Nonspecific acid phosphatase precursor [Burkholderiaceae bacterium]|jgi:acid phosphatase (class A)|nr:MAG: Nonspecific acid phosphatase precursor [Burkholderiaceae bacterium]